MFDVPTNFGATHLFKLERRLVPNRSWLILYDRRSYWPALLLGRILLNVNHSPDTSHAIDLSWQDLTRSVHRELATSHQDGQRQGSAFSAGLFNVLDAEGCTHLSPLQNKAGFKIYDHLSKQMLSLDCTFELNVVDTCWYGFSKNILVCLKLLGKLRRPQIFSWSEAEQFFGIWWLRLLLNHCHLTDHNTKLHNSMWNYTNFYCYLVTLMLYST